MTGFGASSTSIDAGRLTVEVRSVNARSLDVRLKMPDLFTDATLWAEQLVRGRLRRGRVEITIVWEADAARSLWFDKALAVEAMRGFAEVSKELGEEGPVPLSLLASVPGVFGSQRLSVDARDAAARALGAALSELDRDRAREGAVIAKELVDRAERVLAAIERARSRAGALPAAMRARLADRVAKLSGITVDASRLEAEIALLCERYDVAEELSRLTTHVSRLRDLVSRTDDEGGHGHGHAQGHGEGDGRRLDFLLQEALREATTLAVKAQDAEVSADVVEMKVELERMREQVQNVE